MPEVLYAVLLLGVAWTLAMREAPLWLWAGVAVTAALLWQLGFGDGTFAPAPPHFGSLLLLWLPALVLVLFAIPPVRRFMVIEPAFDLVKRLLPKVSETETQALEAGTVGFDAELFSGRPDWEKLRTVPAVQVTAEEQAFLDGPTEELCRRIDDWQIRHDEKEIPDAIWSFVRQQGFLGMLISKAHGGLGFSAQAQSLVLGKIASRSPDVATIVMVPNSLGPGELIEKYGTEEQRQEFLPRLARGDEIPCFSLTGPTSGSDAATMRDVGYVDHGWHEGRETLGIKLSWEKRYITLGPKATLVGLAFHLLDPERHLGKGEDIGITLALVPASHPGVSIGRRHLPCGTAFPNGPNSGINVFIPMDWVIGGEKMAGQGWRMLMECLAAGRSISLPASSTAGIKSLLRATSAYARIRMQFGLPIGRMEGIEEPLARLVENAYACEAARAVTAAMVSRGEKPSVISALMKYQTTERMRRAVNDALDIHGGRGICDGPSNYLQAAYQMTPIGITVEGANILTRSLITFAQGALRSHPYLYEEIRAANDPDKATGLDIFEEAFGSHVAYTAANVAGALFHNLTGGLFGHVPEKAYGTAEYYRQLSRASRNFALVADLTVLTLGGGLKVKQKLTGRLADALAELYFIACALKRYEDDGKPESDRLVVALAAQNGFARFEQALRGVIDNFPVAPVRWLMRVCVFPLGGHYRPASDGLAGSVVRLVLEPGEFRDRLTRYIFVSRTPEEAAGLLEVTLAKVVAAEPTARKLERAIKDGTVRRYHGLDWIGEAVAKGVLTEGEASALREAEALVAQVIAVDSFDPAEVKPHYAELVQDGRRFGSVAAE